MYSYRYINPQYQFGVTSFTLVLEDLDTPTNPVLRIDKSFNVDSSMIDDDFLYQQARPDIIAANQLDPTVVQVPDKFADVAETPYVDPGDGGDGG